MTRNTATRSNLLSLAVAIALLLPYAALAESRCGERGATPPLPDTISPAAIAFYTRFAAMRASVPAESPPQTLADWDARHEAMEAMIAKYMPTPPGATVVPVTLAEVPVLKVIPHTPDKRRTLIYVHGGGFTLFSAKSTLYSAILMATKVSMTVYSIDYTVAPHARWPEITDQVIVVYKALLAQGHAPGSIGMFGDSAGGSIVGGSVLKLRDAGVPMPGALVLQSPWSDVTDSGDTYCTLSAADPVLTVKDLAHSAAAYAPVTEQKNPYVSPVYADYAKGYPPTLIQGGTREIFLSNFVRQYQAIQRAGGIAVLDLYEGMPHVFQSLMPGAPESDAAYTTAKRFWLAHLER